MSLITPDFGLLVWMTLIFGIVFFILAKFGFPAITSMVDKRSTRIEEALRKAEEAERRLANMAEEHDALMEKTRIERSEMLRQASEAGEKILESARQQARDEAQKIIEHAKTEIRAERESTLREMHGQLSLLSIEIAEKVVRKSLEGDGEQLAYVEQLVQEAEKTHIRN